MHSPAERGRDRGSPGRGDVRDMVRRAARGRVGGFRAHHRPGADQRARAPGPLLGGGRQRFRRHAGALRRRGPGSAVVADRQWRRDERERVLPGGPGPARRPGAVHRLRRPVHRRRPGLVRPGLALSGWPAGQHRDRRLRRRRRPTVAGDGDRQARLPPGRPALEPCRRGHSAGSRSPGACPQAPAPATPTPSAPAPR